MERVFEITLTVTTSEVVDENDLDRRDWRQAIHTIIPDAYVCIVDSRLVHEPD